MGLVKTLSLLLIAQWLQKVIVLFVKLKGLDKKVMHFDFHKQHFNQAWCG